MLYWVLKYILLGPFCASSIGRRSPGWSMSRPMVRSSWRLITTRSWTRIFLPLMVKRPMTFLAKDEYFITPGFKGFPDADVLQGVGQVPIDRSGGNASEAALRTGVKVLAGGNILGIYPEGTRSPDGKLYRGHTGVARMALAANAPVIPVALHGTREVQPPERRCRAYARSRLTSVNRSTSLATRGWTTTDLCCGR